jgi:hypothetical protein
MYYEPQTTYLVSLVISIITITVAMLYIVLATIRKFVQNRKMAKLTL